MSAPAQALLMAASASAYSGWTPASGTTPYAWYISDDSGNTSSGGFYTSIADKSGNARHLSASELNNINVAASGINTRTTFNSPAGGSRINLPSATGMLNAATGWCAAFSTYRQDTGVATQTLFFAETAANNTSRANLQIEGGTDDTPRIVSRRDDGDSASILNAGTTVSEAGYALLVGGVDIPNQDARIRVNGNETNDLAFGTSGSAFSATNSYGGPWLLASNPSGSPGEGFKGNVGEIVVYNVPISQSEMEKLEGYLAHSWGLTSLLPGGHPYKTTPPT